MEISSTTIHFNRFPYKVFNQRSLTHLSLQIKDNDKTVNPSKLCFPSTMFYLSGKEKKYCFSFPRESRQTRKQVLPVLVVFWEGRRQIACLRSSGLPQRRRIATTKTSFAVPRSQCAFARVKRKWGHSWACRKSWPRFGASIAVGEAVCRFSRRAESILVASEKGTLQRSFIVFQIT